MTHAPGIHAPRKVSWAMPKVGGAPLALGRRTSRRVGRFPPLAAGATLLACLACSGAARVSPAPSRPLRKLGDRVIYQDDRFYCAFPSVVVRPDGEMLCAFRRAPDRRRLWGAKDVTHTDANSYLMLVRSRDGGATWTREPELIYAHPFGGSQDPCMVQLRDGSIVCSSYGWALVSSVFVCLGGFILRSDDGGRSWRGPFVPPALPDEQTIDVLGRPLPASNRGAMVERRDGTLAWAVVRLERAKPERTSVHLLVSDDRAETWRYACPVAAHEAITFNETSLVETPKGDLVAFMRTEAFGGKLAVARSTDGGRSFGPWLDTRVVGHPFHAARLPDGRVLLVYGYREKPYGIRARVLDPECANVKEAPELVLRDDGGCWDLGYPWATALPDGRALVVYYFNLADGPRHIAATWLGP